MRDSLTAGIRGSSEHVVTPDLSPPHLSRVVLSTPDMVRLIEVTCHEAVVPHLDEGEVTVGTHVCVSHAAAATEDEVVAVDVELVDVDRRRLEFTTRVTVGERVVSEGTHQRFVVRDAG